MLSDLAGWHSVRAAPRTEIVAALSCVRPVDSVAIYDVGQGASTALLSQGAPVLYFDLGGSVLGNKRSFPTSLDRFCFTLKPPIVLSHWDWDHWSSGLRDRRALNRTWILPIQKDAGDLGAVHARFVAMLIAGGANIMWWDYSTKMIPIAGTDAMLFRALGSPSDRNESGLALSIPASIDHVMLPGDASLASVNQANLGLSYLMVPHHGGRTVLQGLQQHKPTRGGHLIYSYGVGNHYLHPLPTTVRSLRTVWKKNVHTPLRDHGGVGHVGIDLTERNIASPKLPCGYECQLGIRQWI